MEDITDDFLDGDSFEELTLPLEPPLFTFVLTSTGFLMPAVLATCLSTVFFDAAFLPLVPVGMLFDGTFFVEDIPETLPVAFLAPALTLLEDLELDALSPADFEADPFCSVTFLEELFFLTAGDLA